jgi:DNA-binding MarR family transcriptional regulator
MSRLELTTSVFREFGIIQERVEAIFKGRLPADLPAAQFKLLNHLIYTTNQHEAVSDLAKHSHVSLPAMSQVIKQLRTKGYVELKEHREDTRKKTVLITKAGRLSHNNALKSIDINLEEFSKKFSIKDMQKLYELSHKFRCTFEDHHQV